MQKLLILYTEYAPYLHSCLLKFSQQYNYEVHIVRYPLDKNAPFKFSDSSLIKFYERNQLDKNGLRDLYKKLNPSCVLVSGWVDNGYNSILPEIKNDGKVVIDAVDNLWVGSVKQRLFTSFAKYFLNKRFTHIWVPGIYQFDYIRKLGIEAERIMTGFYSADSDLFLPKYTEFKNIPKKFIYVGRLLDIKGTPTLLKGIELINKSIKTDWEFLIIGNGVHESSVKQLCGKYSNVKYKPFMQPEELAKELANGGIFVLPSNYDAWGAVVHEHAMLGFPFILSSMVGSRNYFVVPGYNGYIFKSQNPGSLAESFKKIINLDQDTLLNMSRRSHEIGRTINTEGWAARLNETILSHYEKQL